MKSLRAHLTQRLLVGGILLLAVAGVSLDWWIHRSLTATLDTSLRDAAQALAVRVEHKTNGVKIEKDGAPMLHFDEPGSGEVFLLRTVDGVEVARSFSLGDASLPLVSQSADAHVFFDAPLPDGTTLRCVARRFLPDMGKKARESGNVPIEAVLTLGRDRASLDHTLTTLRAALLLIGAATLAGLVMIIRLGVRAGLAPVHELATTLSNIDAHSLDTRLPATPLPAELRPIAERLNELFARLGGAFSREQRFTANAAHEFRTPLAELRALAEVSLSTPGTVAENTESWADVLASTRRMESLAACLLQLTRAENPATILVRNPVPLAQAVAAAWGESTGLVNEIPPSLTASTDPVVLGIILSNLCSNARSHAPGETLRATATQDATGIALHFRNRAANLVESDIPQLFERFWRKDAARSAATHHGLGLALAADFAALLSGSLTAHLAAGDIEFSLCLPGA